MILPIEKWMNEQRYPTEVTNLLEEGIICYKSGAYRAGLLFSYLGFEKIIKNRLLDARRPDNFPEGLWNKIQKALQNDTGWEETVFKSITSYSNYPIFLQDNSKREEMNRHLLYWKDRRNDAAHAKENEINYTHVESFWAFMQSYLPKLVVRGSRVGILDSLKKHFDPRLTPPNTDFSYIIDQIKHSLYDDDLISFYQKVLEIFKAIDGLYTIFPNEELNKFWDELFKLGDPFSAKLIRFLKEESNFVLFSVYIEEYTHRIALFHEDEPFIRNLWYEKIKNFRNPTNLLAALLRNNLVEEKYKEDAFLRLISNLKNTLPNENDYRTLTENGYLIVFKKKVFSDSHIDAYVNNFSWAKLNAESVLHFIMHNGLDEQIVRCLCHVFERLPYPRKLSSVLDEFLRSNREIREDFIKIANELRLDPPTSLGFDEQVE